MDTSTLRAVEKARKLLNLAYDKSVTTPERELALHRAKEALARVGLTIEDLKKESTPDYLTRVSNAQGQYSPRTGKAMASALRRGGWKSEDPRNEAYKDYKGGE